MRTSMNRYLHRPFMVGSFEADDLVIMVALVILIAVSDYWQIVLFASPVIMIGYKKIKKNKPRGYLGHLAYRFGLIKFSNYPDSSQKKFAE